MITATPLLQVNHPSTIPLSPRPPLHSKLTKANIIVRIACGVFVCLAAYLALRCLRSFKASSVLNPTESQERPIPTPSNPIPQPPETITIPIPESPISNDCISFQYKNQQITFFRNLCQIAVNVPNVTHIRFYLNSTQEPTLTFSCLGILQPSISEPSKFNHCLIDLEHDTGNAVTTQVSPLTQRDISSRPDWIPIEDFKQLTGLEITSV